MLLHRRPMNSPSPTADHKSPAVLPTLLITLIAVLCPPLANSDALYKVRQTYTVKQLPEGAKRVQGWFWMPEDRV